MKKAIFNFTKWTGIFSDSEGKHTVFLLCSVSTDFLTTLQSLEVEGA